MKIIFDLDLNKLVWVGIGVIGGGIISIATYSCMSREVKLNEETTTAHKMEVVADNNESNGFKCDACGKVLHVGERFYTLNAANDTYICDECIGKQKDINKATKKDQDPINQWMKEEKSKRLRR